MFDCSNDQVFVWKRHCAKKWATWRWERRCQKRQFCHLTLDARQETGSSWFEPNPKNSIKRLQLMTGFLIVAYDSNHALSKINIHKSLYVRHRVSGSSENERKWRELHNPKTFPFRNSFIPEIKGQFLEVFRCFVLRLLLVSEGLSEVLGIACCRCHIFRMRST